MDFNPDKSLQVQYVTENIGDSELLKFHMTYVFYLSFFLLLIEPTNSIIIYEFNIDIWHLSIHSERRIITLRPMTKSNTRDILPKCERNRFFFFINVKLFKALTFL